MGYIISLIEENRGISFNIGKNYENHYYLELVNPDDKVICHYICDTFTTGNFIMHLKKAVKKYLKTKNKIGMCRWHPVIDKESLIFTDSYPYINATVYTNDEGNGRIKFLVYLRNTKNPYVFTTSVADIQEKLF